MQQYHEEFRILFTTFFFCCEPLLLYFCIHALNGESASNIIPFNVMLFMSFVPSFGNNNSLQTKMHNPYRLSVWFVRIYFYKIVEPISLIEFYKTQRTYLSVGLPIFNQCNCHEKPSDLIVVYSKRSVHKTVLVKRFICIRKYEC